MTPDQAIRGLIVAGQVEAIESLVSSGYDTDDALGESYLKHRANAKTETQAAVDPLKGNGMDKSFRKLLVDAGYVPTIRRSIYD